MAVRRWLAGSIGVALPVLAVVLLLATPALAVSRDARIQGTLAGLRVPFVPNQGQTDPAVKFMARTGSGTLFLTEGEAVLGPVRMRLASSMRRFMVSPAFPADCCGTPLSSPES